MGDFPSSLTTGSTGTNQWSVVASNIGTEFGNCASTVGPNGNGLGTTLLAGQQTASNQSRSSHQTPLARNNQQILKSPSNQPTSAPLIPINIILQNDQV